MAELNAKLDQLAEESQANKSLIEDLSAKLNSSGINNPSGDKNTPIKTDVKNKPTGTRQCKATTKKGTQCTRNAQEGSDYCWQHQGYSRGNSQNISSGSREIMTGPRGGQYYINSKGKKTYVRKKK